MIDPAYARAMAAYNAEVNRRFYAAAGRLPEARRREAAGLFWSSIHGTLCHLLWADRMWMSRLAGWERPPVPLAESGGLMAEFDALAAARAETDAALIAWADGLNAAALGGTLAWYSGATRQERTAPVWLIVTHLFNHQTHHRGQAHAALTRFGEDTGATDLPFVLPDLS